MTLRDDVANVLPELRRQAQLMMTDTCEIGFMSDRGPLDPETNEYGPAELEPVYVGPCQFKAGGVQASDVDAGTQLLVSQLSVLKLPVADDSRITLGTSGVVRKDMVARILTSASDSALPGTTATVRAPFRGAYTTARRLAVEVTDG